MQIIVVFSQLPPHLKYNFWNGDNESAEGADTGAAESQSDSQSAENESQGGDSGDGDGDSGFSSSFGSQQSVSDALGFNDVSFGFEYSDETQAGLESLGVSATGVTLGDLGGYVDNLSITDTTNLDFMELANYQFERGDYGKALGSLALGLVDNVLGVLGAQLGGSFSSTLGASFGTALAGPVGGIVAATIAGILGTRYGTKVGTSLGLDIAKAIDNPSFDITLSLETFASEVAGGDVEGVLRGIQEDIANKSVEQLLQEALEIPGTSNVVSSLYRRRSNIIGTGRSGITIE